MARKVKFKWIARIEERKDGKKMHNFYLNDGLSKGLEMEHENYKDNLIKVYEEILFFTQTSNTEFIDLTKK